MNVVQEMPAYSSMPGFMCGRVFDVHSSRCSGLLWTVKARSFAQLGLSDGGCKLSFLPPTLEYSSRTRGEMTGAWKVRVYHPMISHFGDWKRLVLSLWQLNWDQSEVLFGCWLINKAYFASSYPSLYLKCRCLRCGALCTLEEHCKWGSVCHPMLWLWWNQFWLLQSFAA